MRLGPLRFGEGVRMQNLILAKLRPRKRASIDRLKPLPLQGQPQRAYLGKPVGTSVEVDEQPEHSVHTVLGLLIQAPHM